MAPRWYISNTKDFCSIILYFMWILIYSVCTYLKRNYHSICPIKQIYFRILKEFNERDFYTLYSGFVRLYFLTQISTKRFVQCDILLKWNILIHLSSKMHFKFLSKISKSRNELAFYIIMLAIWNLDIFFNYILT